MQFKDTLLRVILFLLTTSLVVSCITVDKSLGDDYIPDEEIYKVKSTSFALPLVTKSMDSLQAVSSLVTTFGAIRTPEFGLYKSNSIANVAPGSTELNFGKDPEIISIYFLAPVSYTSVMKDGQESIPQDIKIYRTLKKVDTTDIYSCSIDASFIDDEPLNLTSSTYFGGDTIKVFLKNEYGTELLTATETELDSIDLFVERFKGLYIECSTPEDGLYGGRLNYMSYGDPIIVMKYNFLPTWEEDLSRKDTTISLSFGDYYCVNPCSYSSEDLQSNEQQEYISIEGNGGIKPYISGSALKDIFDTWLDANGYDRTDVAIIRARFSLPFEIPTDLDMTKYPNTLFPTYWFTDSTLNVYSLIEDVYTTSNNQGAMNRSLEEYYGDFSSYIQNLIIKEDSEITESDDIWFAPILTYEDSYYGTTSYLPNSDQYYVGKINGPTASRVPQMEIVYTIIK